MLKENSISLGGWNRKIDKRVKGYTLIETIAVISISTIVMAIGFTLIISTYKNYANIIEESTRIDEIDNALLSIDRLLTGNMITEINPNIVKNEIEVNYLRDHEKTLVKTKLIRHQGEKLVVETHNKGQPDNSLLVRNTILKDVKAFTIIQKEKLYYYKITLKTGDEIIQCI